MPAFAKSSRNVAAACEESTLRSSTPKRARVGVDYAFVETVMLHSLAILEADVIGDGLGRRTDQNHERDGTSERDNRRSPAAVAKRPEADSLFINQRIGRERIVNGRDVDSAL